jgi:hypothetical protein
VHKCCIFDEAGKVKVNHYKAMNEKKERVMDLGNRTTRTMERRKKVVEARS